MATTTRSRGLRAPARHGIYLISTLLLLTSLVIVSGAVVVTFSTSLASSGNLSNRHHAMQAAMCGLAYVQARLESNAATYSPQVVPASTTLSTLDSHLQVVEVENSIRGYVESGSINGGAAGFKLLFRVAFNNDYTSYLPPSAVGRDFNTATFNGVSYRLPDFRYLSANNLNRSATAAMDIYDTAGKVMRRVPGGMVDVLVEGLALGPNGNVLATRLVESVLSVDQVGTLRAGASAARDLDLDILQSGGQIVIGSNSSLAASLAALKGDIRLSGQDASNGAPPNYLSSSRALLGSNNSTLTYTSAGSTSDFTDLLATRKAVVPPAISPSQLPALSGNASKVDAGTWVVWNGQLYHYPTSYQARDASGEPMALSRQPWTQPDPTRPPLYNGVTTDTAGGMASLDGNGALRLDPATNTVRVTRDVAVKNIQGISDFALVVAPSRITTATGSSSITSPSFASDQAGSAQLVFEPGAGNTPQLRGEGALTVLGNVLGQGALVSTGAATSITVVGRSALDSRSDSGVALYATGDLNFLQLSHAQAPASVPGVDRAFRQSGIVPGSGSGRGTSSTEVTATLKQVRQALSRSMYKDGQFNAVKMKFENGVQTGITVQTQDAAAAGQDINDSRIDFTFSDGSTVLQATPQEVVSHILGTTVSLEQMGRLMFSADPVQIGSESYPSMIATAPGAWPTQDAQGTRYIDTDGQPCCFISTTHMQSYMTVGETEATDPQASSSASPQPTGSPSPQATGTASSQALNQAFRGLVYAGRNLRFKNNLGNISIDGAVTAFGGDPTQGVQAAGEEGGNLSLTANNISIQYDPQVLGLFSSFFGGQVSLKRCSTTNF